MTRSHCGGGEPGRSNGVAASFRTRDGAIAMVATFTLLGAVVGSWASRVPAVRAAAGLGTLGLGLALLGLAVGAVVAMPIVGWLVGRAGSVQATQAGVTLCCVTLPLTSLARDFAELAGALIGLGVSIGTLDVAMNAYAVGLERRVGKPMLSAFHAFYSVGGFIGAGVGALAAGLRQTPTTQFLIVVAFAAVAWIAFVPRRLDVEADLGSTVSQAPRTRRLHQQRIALPVLLLGAIAFCALFAEGAATDWSVIYIHTTVGAGAAAGAATYAGFALAMTVARLSSDRLSDILGPVVVTRLGALVAGCGLGIGLLIGSAAAGIAGFICLGAGLAPIVPNVFRAAAMSPGTSPGAGIATGTTIGYLGFMVGPPLIGAAGHAFGLATGLGFVVLATVVVALLAGMTRISPTAELSAKALG